MRTTASAMTISMVADAVYGDGSADDASNYASAGAAASTTGNSFVIAGGAPSNRPARNLRRYLNTMLAFTAFAMASFKTDTPASSAAAARRRLNATG